MAGRLLPPILAAIAGVSISVATFQPELKKQQKRRLEEEYKRDIEAAAREGASPSPPKLPSQPQQPQPAPTITSEENKPSTLSSMLGLWAWKRQDESDSSSARKN